MDKKTRNLVLSALFAALTVISLYIASVWPTGLFGLAAFASLFGAAAIIDSGLLSGVYVYIASSIVGLLLLPNKAPSIVYIFMFGYYPVIKSLIERLKSKIAQWTLKLVAFNASLTILWFLFKEMIFNFGNNPPSLVLLYLGGSVVYALFDYGYTKVIWLYINRVSRFINK
ncbi:MAG: hypothetical protein FWH57_08180 [Oscillospiraceae bacterium]|nr:hypothetical protein [Oscillospiraceae bacterium]